MLLIRVRPETGEEERAADWSHHHHLSQSAGPGLSSPKNLLRFVSPRQREGRSSPQVFSRPEMARKARPGLGRQVTMVGGISKMSENSLSCNISHRLCQCLISLAKRRKGDSTFLCVEISRSETAPAQAAPGRSKSERCSILRNKIKKCQVSVFTVVFSFRAINISPLLNY